MDLKKFLEERMKRLTLFDMSLVKLGCIAFGALLGTYFPAFVLAHFNILAGLVLMDWLYLVYKFYLK